MFEKVANAICWAAVIFLGLFVLVIFIFRYVLNVGAGLAWLFAYSDLPWWVMVPAAIALLAGFVFLSYRSYLRSGRVPPNRKFLD